jgi:predicted ATP-dependent endonuclease of OLD family
LQQTFASYIEKFLEKLSDNHIQVIITSHSGHIANTMDFSKIRYAQKHQSCVVYKDLNTFSQQHNQNIAFIKKYLTLSRCDLFFADKAILVEGASERILLPDIIDKCDKDKLFDSQKYKLPSQYYSIIEVGGAYAYIFVPFIEFLGIPCLVLTDIDPAIDGKTKSFVSNGKTTFNVTIKWWIRKIKSLGEDENIGLTEDIMSLADENKTIGKCHIEYQTTESGLCGRSLEESIKNVNREHYGISGSPKEEELEFTEKSKTDFALELIDKKPDYKVPQYIKNGLKWLNNRQVLI